MTGLVLCGGKSIRMGSDKGLLKLEAQTWAQTAMDKFEAFDIPVHISVNKTQYKDYAGVFPASILIVDNNTLNIHGPLLGLLSAHLLHPTENIFVLACDMPLMEPAILKELYDIQAQIPADAYVFTNDGEPEPLCGIYTAKALSLIYAMLQNGTLTKFSMKFMLEQLNTYTIPLADDQKKYFRNFNAHAALNGL